MDRTGILGGGPGSAPGERRCAKERWEEEVGCMMWDVSRVGGRVATRGYLVDGASGSTWIGSVA
jgi:hypothetical protein